MSDMKQPPATAMSKIDEAVEHIVQSRNWVDRMRRHIQQGEPLTDSLLDNLDDKLHDALAALGQ